MTTDAVGFNAADSATKPDLGAIRRAPSDTVGDRGAGRGADESEDGDNYCIINYVAFNSEDCERNGADEE